MEQRLAESRQAGARVCQQRLADATRQLEGAPGGIPNPATVERVRLAERMRQGYPASPGAGRGVQRQRREGPSTRDVERAGRAGRAGRVEQTNSVAVERVRTSAQMRREHPAEREARRQGGGARARESATSAERGDTAMVGDDAFARERERLLRRQQQEQASAWRRECRREDERTRVEQQRRLRRQERWNQAAEGRRQRILVDIDAVRRRTQEADRIQRRRWLLREQRWERNLARRRERTLIDLDIIRRNTEDDIERIRQRMEEDTARIQRRSSDAVTRVWQQLDIELAIDAYDGISDENEVSVGSQGRMSPATQQEGAAPAIQPVSVDDGRGEGGRQAELEGQEGRREHVDGNEGRQAPQQ
eukprot:jgi/Undpi1/13970/HiC_scaffold_9.g03621.m1